MRGCDAAIGKQPLKVFRSFAVEAKLDGRIYFSVKKVNAHRRVHAKDDIKSPVAQCFLHIFVCMTTFGFVEDDKLDIRYVGQERCFGLADDPGDVSVRPVVLDATHDCQRMTGIPDRR